MKNSIHALVLLLAIVSLQSCYKEPTSISEKKIEGILLTDENGNILGGDVTDFQPRPKQDSLGKPSNFSFDRAYPNPTSDNFITLKFQLPVSDSITFRMYSQSNELLVFSKIRYTAGVHTRQWGNPYSKGIYRIEMSNSNGFSSYGDVEFK